MSGSSGSTILSGTDGNDMLNGGSGDDILTGGDGNDRLNGGAGSDILDGGSGNDILNGGSGDDTLIYKLAENTGATDLYTGGSGIDTLRLELTLAEWQTASVRQEVFAYLQHLATVKTNAKTGEVSNGAASDFTFDFDASKLTVQMTEKLEVWIVDGDVRVKVIDSSDRSALAPSAPDLIASSDSGSSDSDNLTNDSTPTLVGSGAEPLATVKLYAGTTLVGTATAGLDGTWSITSSALSDGVHALTVEQTDLLGNTSPRSAALNVTIDTTADAGADLALTISDTTINNAEKTAVGFSVAGLDADATGVVTFSDGTNSVTVNVSGNGSFSADLSTLADGNITSVLNVTDDAGNTASASGAAIDLDTTAGVAATDLKLVVDTIPGGNNLPNGAFAHFVVTDSDGGGAHQFSMTAPSNFSINSTTGVLSTTGLASGTTYTLNVQVTQAGATPYSETFSIQTGTNADNTLNGSGDDVIYALQGNDLVYAGSGDDTVFGQADADTIYGGDGNDVLYGNAGDDKLFGDAGDDVLYGGAGDDELTGGAGADTFVFESGGGVDKILDFQANGTDLILLVGFNNIANESGFLRSADFASGAANGTFGSDVNIIFDPTTGNLYYDSNGGNTTSGRSHLGTITIADGGTFDYHDIKVGP